MVMCTEMSEIRFRQLRILDYVIKLRNWNYGYNRALNKRNHGIYCTTYTENRAIML